MCKSGISPVAGTHVVHFSNVLYYYKEKTLLIGNIKLWLSNLLKGQYHKRSFKFLCKKYARIIKVYSLVTKIIFKRQIGINSISRRSMIFSDFPPSNIVKLENVGPTLFKNFRPLLSYSFSILLLSYSFSSSSKSWWHYSFNSAGTRSNFMVQFKLRKLVYGA